MLLTRTLPRALAVAVAASLALAVPPGTDAAPDGAAEAGPRPVHEPERRAGGAPYLVGRGIADVTGEPAQTGMMGYADTSQVTEGLHMRQRSRAFIIVDRRTGERVVHVVADIGMFFQGIHDEILGEVRERFGSLYGERNVMLTATHTHAGVGGYSHHNMYNIFSGFFHERTYRAIVEGVVASIVRAHEDLAPARLTVATSRLDNANVNRSRTAFALNPRRDRRFFDDATDTQSTTLRVIRDGRVVGAINWFPVHATSMSTDNHLISPDNKGYAEYRWEEVAGVDHLADRDPRFVASFAQTNAGDMSPNLNLRPSDGPTTDEFKNTRIIGSRQLRAARGADGARAVTGGVDSRTVYVDLDGYEIDGRWTPDGEAATTCAPALGAAFAAGSTEDGGGGLPIFHEGAGGGNPIFDLISNALYTASPALRDCQAPKEILLPVGDLGLASSVVPVQLVRIGDLYLIGLPAEVTIVAGLRLRRAVADVVGVPVRQVLVQGYANHYIHYLTTPEEYDAQEYEGASTIFGRNELPALTQVSVGLARAMRSGRAVPLGAKDDQPTPFADNGLVPADTPPSGGEFGDVTQAPESSYEPGEVVTVAFAGAYPNNDLRHGSTYLKVERLRDGRWRRVADDGDWSTKLHWKRTGSSGSTITIEWQVPGGTPAGRYRIRYFGDARTSGDALTPISGTSPVFHVD
ncbi:neutral ceramidase [Nocardioides thalensis]|uniref:Neutral ceramidase n=1 Tax=Nocardioides thalensis TaxID=1914755 RepID=A0A853C363_9ACTN|nr:neutral/alkaline ceramidase [Nocardioides thalensis]NYJ01627.1 neutral ceramidase [Nocardioides thalensis]